MNNETTDSPDRKTGYHRLRAAVRSQYGRIIFADRPADRTC